MSPYGPYPPPPGYPPYPPPAHGYPPQGYGPPPGWQPPPQRWTALTVIGILQIIFGAIGLGGAVISPLMRGISKGGPAEAVDALMHSGPVGVWTTTSLVLGAILGAASLTAGIGVLRRRGWARKLSLAHAIATIVVGVIGQVVMFLFVYPALSELARGLGPIGSAAATGGLVGGIVAGTLGFALPIVVIVIMTRPRAREELVN